MSDGAERPGPTAGEPERTLSVGQARRVYDRIGRGQDTQGFYEGPAIEALLAEAGFERARSVLEIGCGTGSLARRLLQRRLPPEARYLGTDVSPRMVSIARGRLRPWSERAEVTRSDGSPVLAAADGSVDRVLATYVFDLLSVADTRALLAEARRVLAPGGRLCAVSLTAGREGIAALVSGAWERLFALRPQLTGGCRPIDLLVHLDRDRWEIVYRSVIAAWGISSQVVVATPRSAAERPAP